MWCSARTCAYSSASSSSSCPTGSSTSSSKLPAGTSYRRKMGLLGSFTSTNLPSPRLRHISTMVRTIPQPLDSDRFIWLAKSFGFQPITPRITCLSFDLGLARDTKLWGHTGQGDPYRRVVKSGERQVMGEEKIPD